MHAMQKESLCSLNMRRAGLPEELEHRRYLAVERILEGYTTQEVAEFLGVDPSSVRRWVSIFKREGGEGLRAHIVPGRPWQRTRTEEKVVLHWLEDAPTEHGFRTELWTGKRLAQSASINNFPVSRCLR